jgi:hypothetical protein
LGLGFGVPLSVGWYLAVMALAFGRLPAPQLPG